MHPGDMKADDVEDTDTNSHDVEQRAKHQHCREGKAFAVARKQKHLRRCAGNTNKSADDDAVDNGMKMRLYEHKCVGNTDEDHDAGGAGNCLQRLLEIFLMIEAAPAVDG